MDWIEQEMGRLKTQDQSLHQQFDHVKKSLNHICEVKKERKESLSGEDENPMAAMHSDSNLLPEGNKSNNNSYSNSLSQDSYMLRAEEEERSGAPIQRRETLATFHQYREMAAKKERKAQSSEPEPTHYTWRKKEHIYESLDDVIGDFRVAAPASISGGQLKKSKRNSADPPRERSQKPVISNLIKPHHHSADRLPSQYHPVSLARKTSPKVSSKESSQSPNPENIFSSLQSADSGYNSTERILIPGNVGSGATAASRSPGVSTPRRERQLSKKESVTSSSDRTNRNVISAQKSSKAVPQHRRQGSSPAYISADVLTTSKAGVFEAPQPTKLVPLSKVTSPKAKSGKSKSQKSKSKSGIGFLSTLNKVSGTESVSDFDFRPSTHHTTPVNNQSESLHILSQSHPVYTPHNRVKEHEPVSYIGAIGPEYNHQSQHLPDQLRQSSHTGRHLAMPEEKRVNFKESGKKSSRRSSSSSKNPSGRPKQPEDSHLRYQSLSQPAQDEFEDSTLVLYKSKQTSYDDSGVAGPVPSSPRRVISKRASPPHPVYTGKHTPDTRHIYHKRPGPVFPVMEETWC